MKRALTWGVALAVVCFATTALAGGGGGGGPGPGGGGGAPEPEAWALMLFSLAPGAFFARRALRR